MEDIMNERIKRTQTVMMGKGETEMHQGFKGFNLSHQTDCSVIN